MSYNTIIFLLNTVKTNFLNKWFTTWSQLFVTNFLVKDTVFRRECSHSLIPLLSFVLFFVSPLLIWIEKVPKSTLVLGKVPEFKDEYLFFVFFSMCQLSVYQIPGLRTKLKFCYLVPCELHLYLCVVKNRRQILVIVYSLVMKINIWVM